jgi:hypothetical protein
MYIMLILVEAFWRLFFEPHALKISQKVDQLRGAGISIIGGGADIHIFVCTDCENNRFQKKLIGQNTNILMNICPLPQLSIFRRLWTS